MLGNDRLMKDVYKLTGAASFSNNCQISHPSMIVDMVGQILQTARFVSRKSCPNIELAS